MSYWDSGMSNLGGQPGGGPSYPGYAQLLQQVLQGIQGQGSAMLKQIQNTGAREVGSLTNASYGGGLPPTNSSASQALDIRRPTEDTTLAEASLGSQLAAQQAGYTSQIGTMGLQQQGQYQMAQQQMGQQQILQQQQLNAQRPLGGYLQNQMNNWQQITSNPQAYSEYTQRANAG